MPDRLSFSAESVCASPLSHQDEFPAEYSLAGCSPAEPASASPAILIFNRKPPVRYLFSANGNCPLTSLSQFTTQGSFDAAVLEYKLTY